MKTQPTRAACLSILAFVMGFLISALIVHIYVVLTTTYNVVTF